MASIRIKIEDAATEGLLLSTSKSDSKFLHVAAVIKLSNNRIIETSEPEFYPMGKQFESLGNMFLASACEHFKGLLGNFCDRYEQKYCVKYEKLSRVVYSKHRLKNGEWLVKIYDPNDQLVNYGVECLFSTEALSYDLIF